MVSARDRTAYHRVFMWQVKSFGTAKQVNGSYSEDLTAENMANKAVEPTDASIKGSIPVLSIFIEAAY